MCFRTHGRYPIFYVKFISVVSLASFVACQALNLMVVVISFGLKVLVSFFMTVQLDNVA